MPFQSSAAPCSRPALERSAGVLFTAFLLNVGCGTRPADPADHTSDTSQAGDASQADVTPGDTGATRPDVPDCDSPYFVRPGPAYTPDPSWGSTRAVASGDIIMAAMPFQSDADDSHWIQAFGENTDDAVLAAGELSLIDAADGRALVSHRTATGYGLYIVSADGTEQVVIRDAAEQIGQFAQGSGLWDFVAQPTRPFDGTRITWIGSDGRAQYFDGQVLTSLSPPPNVTSFRALELMDDGLIALGVDNRSAQALFAWSASDRAWRTVADTASEPMWPDAAAAVFWTQADGIYMDDGGSQRIFEGTCGPVDAWGTQAVFACFGAAGEVAEAPDYPTIFGTLWHFDGATITEVSTNGGHVHAPRLNQDAIAWIEYPLDPDALCTGTAEGEVYIARASSLDRPEAAGPIRSGCACCGFPGGPLEFSLSDRYVVWNYVATDQRFATGWTSVSYAVACR